MLELLLYCHLFANIRYAAEIAAVADFIATALMHGRAWLMRSFGREHPAMPFGPAGEQACPQVLAGSLARLDAYVSSMA